MIPKSGERFSDEIMLKLKLSGSQLQKCNCVPR
jgi:hypothetical protein